ncbi:tyrosine-type recombinase/integrase [Urbifossiella limnaea]|uniref:tyrosine-type recombinase/integrase n=1 Tax=Urbifossiella limnaea TaxID=2528023 RepID=UPI00192E2F49|nr:site-specific integrase [Urbifossiella limnaea]
MDATGKRRRKTIYGTSKKDVAEKLRKLQAENDAGRLVETEQLTTGEYLTRWLHNTAKEKVHDGTWERYRQVTELYLIPTLGGIKLSKLAPLHVEQSYAQMVVGASDRKVASAWTRKTAGIVLSLALKHAVRMKLILHNPAADVAKARPVAREMVFLTELQARLFLDAAKSHRLSALYALALGSGMRQGEMFGLQWADIDFDKGTVDVKRSLSWVKGKPVLKEPKSKAGRRTIVLPAFALAALKEHRTAALKAGFIAAPVFCTLAGTPMPKSNFIRRVHAPLVKRANALGVKRAADAGSDSPVQLPAGVRFHDLRHTHATCMIAAGHSIKAVSRRLGHADIGITLKTYAHVMPNDDDKLAAGADALFG